MRGKTLLIGVVGVVIGVLLSAAVVFAGSLNPPAGPGDPGSQMYTLEQIYQRLTTGQYMIRQSAFTEPASEPGSPTMRTLDEIMAVAQPRALAKRVAKTGQTQCWNSGGTLIPCAGTGQDGQYQAGIDPVVAPSCDFPENAYNTPTWTGVRFTDNGDGTVTDNLTALIWLKNGCFGFQTWANALSAANTLNSGECGLTDGSTEGAWRLPNVNELHSLGPTWPPGTPFNSPSFFYWASTTRADLTSDACYVWTVSGAVGKSSKMDQLFVWPVRGGQ